MYEKYPEILTQFITSIIVAFFLVGFIVVIFKLFRKSRLLQEKEKQQMKSDFEKEMLQAQLEIQEDVLKNVSMEIHDNVGQILLLANINLSILQTLKMPAEAPELMRDTKLMLSKASQDISQLSRSLNSDRITDLGVFECILAELGLLEQKKLFAIQIDDQLEDSGKNLPKEMQLLIFRMFQEICNNIIKHANATLISISIKRQGDLIELNISDNGIGFEYSATSGTKSVFNGVGMRSLQSRVKLFGGKLVIDSVLQKGTSISIFIPN